MNIYFTSDQHWMHTNIIKYCKRPFSYDLDGTIANAKDMYEKYREVVKQDDIVVFLGDLAFLNSGNRDIFREMFITLPGKKFLIRGNHDSQPDDYYLSLGFLDVTDFLQIGRYFICHYPLNLLSSDIEKRLLRIAKQYKCDTIIHGHIHEREPSQEGFKRINVCVDYTKFYPVEMNIRGFKTYFKTYLKDIKNGIRKPYSNMIALPETKKSNKQRTKQYKKEVTITKMNFNKLNSKITPKKDVLKCA